MILDGILSWLGIRQPTQGDKTPDQAGDEPPAAAPCDECARLRRLCSSQEDLIAQLEGRPTQATLPPVKVRSAAPGEMAGSLP